GSRTLPWSKVIVPGPATGVGEVPLALWSATARAAAERTSANAARRARLRLPFPDPRRGNMFISPSPCVRSDAVAVVTAKKHIWIRVGLAVSALACGSGIAASAATRPDPATQAQADGCGRNVSALFKKEQPTWVYVGDTGSPA